MTTKEDILEMFRWNSWANEKYREVLAQLELDDLHRDTDYGDLLDRIVHIFASFKMWYQRMNGTSPQTVIRGTDFTSIAQMNDTWREYEKLLQDYVEQITDEELDAEVHYTSFDGSEYTRKRRHILLHLTAHPNYHRGQISAIVKSLNLPNFPSTDMVVYFLETGQASRSLNE